MVKETKLDTGEIVNFLLTLLEDCEQQPNS